jgi:three-Cys-motif partner protein
VTDLSIDLPYLKLVSRAKHRILSSYLRPWSVILGSASLRVGKADKVAYVDCFAGGGVYSDEDSKPLPGSPLIALKQARDYVATHPGAERLLFFAERDRATVERLRVLLEAECPDLPLSVRYEMFEETAQTFADDLLAQVEKSRRGIVPTFFFVDPYGHPITVPVMKRILRLHRTEILVNLMWWRLNMDISNSAVQKHVDTLFGHTRWRQEPFMTMSGDAREDAFLAYFAREVGAQFHVDFSVRFSPEDRVPGGAGRTKYYLVHFSNHTKAARLMKHVMFSESDVASELGFSGATMPRAMGSQMALFELTGPDLGQLWGALRHRFASRTVDFRDVILETLSWPFGEKHYREALKAREKSGEVRIDRRKSKHHGLDDGDFVTFLPI